MGKVAVATSDGVLVDGEFNKIQEFYIYNVEGTGQFQFLEKCSVKADFTESPAKYALAVITQLPKDLEAVLAQKIHPYAEQELYDKGIIALMVDLPVAAAVPIYGRKSKFLRRGGRILRFCGSCSGACNTCR
jgi:nitrogen fixation protein NifB